MKLNEFNIQEPDSSTFDLSFIHKTSGDMGKLFPIACMPTLPGDKFKKNDVSAFVRGMPTIAPILDKVDIKINHFYVPYRVLWNKWEEFYSRSDKHKLLGEPAPQFPVMQVSATPQNANYPAGRLADYLGVSKHYTKNDQGQKPSPISAMPFLAYNKIYVDYFIPQRWVNYSVEVGGEIGVLVRDLEQIRKGNGGVIHTELGNVNSEFKIRNVGWNHDYFTNALPQPDLFEGSKMLLQNPELFNKTAGYLTTKTINPYIFEFNPNDDSGSTEDQNGFSNWDKLPTIRDLRKSVALQHYLEKLSYSGGRYEESTKIFWNQDLKTQMLQRSEYLGGDVIPLFANEVESTAATEDAQLGELAGKPIGAGVAKGEYFEADEFGIYMITAHIVPKRSYSDAMSKALWFTTDVDELPNPEFQGIGDEAVYRYELDGTAFKTSAYDSHSIWGYVPRYSQYKTALDRFSGEMRTSLLHWHLGSTAEHIEQFGASCSPEFIKCNPREDIFNVAGSDKFICTYGIDLIVERKLAKNPMPGLGRI